MKITRLIAAVLLVPFVLTTMSCNTISSSNMSYLGADDPTPNVTGRGTHTSWAGIGVTGAGYVETYEQARARASRTAQRRLREDQPPILYNIKVFRENRSWPQILAVTLALAGTAMIAGGQGDTDTYEEYDPYTGRYYEEEEDTSNSGLIVLGALFNVTAAVLGPLRVYDMWLVADYAPAPSDHAEDE